MIRYTRNDLKFIAFISMLLDHFCKVFISEGYLYLIGTTIGRIAFPIFLYLFIESYSYIKDKTKQIILLFTCAIISDIPFYILFKSHNIMFTWLLVYMMLILYDRVKDISIKAIICVVFSILALILRIDYEYIPFIIIFILDTFIIDRKFSIPILVSIMTLEPGCLLSYPLLYSYTYQKEKNCKYLYYLGYPIHLLIYLLVKKYLHY